MHLDVDDSDVADMGACVYTMHADRGDIEDGYRRTQQTPESSLQDNRDCEAMFRESVLRLRGRRMQTAHHSGT